ncbi:NADPH-dependent FMN reductase [Caldicellulosiruptor owensensis OL]|uniref:NADPH-dependent FMN reductase n=1 Tax=Caldicellulosiruptor owensensis (strain ATCC 700167 / DSM 13100 / OL) TaxID=632518 RepID=E4Q650_CALOW|nr:flavodoxin family protein [Caldicellulosiruptor owensensis]ADQ05535.1 NADPH-dependent FMN reductase [Caldicellulosiruptor owensensis OL]
MERVFFKSTVIGSPRKGGNTEILVERVLSGAKEAGAQVEIFKLNELNIRPCQGCNFCQENGRCQQQDDMQKIYDALYSADALVVGSPIYMSYVTAQTKLFLDRLYALLKIGEGSRLPGGKKCVLVYTQGGGTDGEKIMNEIAGFFKWAFNMEIKAIIGNNNLNPAGEVANRKELLEKAFEVGKEIVKGEYNKI